jgi:putative intracellular protease/amidase
LSSSSDLSAFDAIYIPGGVPSSSAIRADAQFIGSLRKFLNDPSNKDKLLAIICSGGETLIELDLLSVHFIFFAEAFRTGKEK